MTPAGRALFQMLGGFAEFERAVIQERVHAGIARARAEGKHLGGPYVSAEIEQAIRAALAAGAGLRKVAKECGGRLGRATGRRRRRDRAAKLPPTLMVV